MQLTASQTQELVKRFPAANNYLIQCELVNELRALKYEHPPKGSGRKLWVESRITELEKLFSDYPATVPLE